MFELVAIRIPKVIAGACLLGGVAINFANVVGRYLLDAPIFWAEEAMIFLVLWSVFLAFIAVTASRAHLKMDLLLEASPAWARALIERAGLVLGVVVMGFLTVQSAVSVEKLWRFGMTSISLEIPMVVPHASVLVGFAASAVIALLLLWRKAE